jgi:uncharacterized membrane protein
MQNADALMAGLGILCAVVGVILLAALLIAIFFLLSMQKALASVSPRNQLMAPGLVWLSLIPGFGLIWTFFIATRVPDSLRNEFRDRDLDDGSDYGKTIGLTYATLSVLSIVGSYGPLAIQDPSVTMIGNCVSSIFSLVGLVLFIMFWVRIAGYSSKLAYEGPRHPDDLDRRLEKFDDPDDDWDRSRPAKDGDKPSPDTYKEGDPGRYQ